MVEQGKGATEIEAQLLVQGATIQLIHYHFYEPPNVVLRGSDKFRVELCLTSRHRSARANFLHRWSPHHFERLGDIFLLSPSMEMLAKSDETSSLTSIACLLDTEPIIAFFDVLPELTDQHLRASLDIRNLRIRSYLQRIAEETRSPGFASDTMVQLLIQQIAIDLFRNGIAITERQQHRGLAPWQLRLIDERLRDAREAPTLPILAELCRISVRQLTRGFRASRACSIGAYVANSQMQHAKRLLAAGESVAAIASRLGFATTSNFCAAFRRSAGLTPGQFRQSLLRH